MAYCNSAARVPSPFQRLVRSSAAVALPPAFLAPRIHAQPFSIQTSRPASVSPSQGKSPNAAQNLKGTLRRLGQGSKWSPQAPSKTPAWKDGKTTTIRAWPRRSSSSPDRKRGHVEDRNRQLGFRLRAKKLHDHLIKASQEIEARFRSRASPAQIEADITAALTHFESEMKALRVMIKSKDVLVDPDNAWKSASRIKAPCNAAIRLCVRTGRFERAFRLLNQMKKDSIFPSASTYTILIQGLTKALLAQGKPPSTDREIEAWLQRKEVQRIRELYQDLEKLWKQAFPRYFQRFGAPKPKDALALDKDDFHTLTEQARRNLVSQQASVQEVREFPHLLSNSIGAYIAFLRLTGPDEELDQLFDRLFPSTLIDNMAKGLASDASPQDRLELANRKLSEVLPLGDVSTFSSFLTPAKEPQGADRLAPLQRIWSRFATLMQLERHERLLASRTVPKQRQTLEASHAKGELDVLKSETEPSRFVPDDRYMVDILRHLQPTPNVDPAPKFRLGLSILLQVYGLDLESSADGIIRDPRSFQNVDKFDFHSYIRSDANAVDGLGQPRAQLRDNSVATFALGMLAVPEAWKQLVALFNYLWARDYAEHQVASLQADTVGGILPNASGLGGTLRPASAMRLLWILAEVGDPAGARVALEAMKQASETASSGDQAVQDVGSGRARRLKQTASRSESREALKWKPADICYIRAMRANLIAMLIGPSGLTAATNGVDSSKTTNAKKRTHDAWPEAKSLFIEWCEQRGGSNSIQRSMARWDANNAAVEWDTVASRTRDDARSSKPEKLSLIHADNMHALFLHLARVCAVSEGKTDAAVAREALALLEERVGLEMVVTTTKKLQDEVADSARSGSKEGLLVPSAKVRTLTHLSKVLGLALDTSEHSFAPKADVELWKRIRKMLPAPSESSEIKPPRENRSSNNSRDVRGRHSGGNRLLLSRDDYLELEAEASAEAEDEEAYEVDEVDRNRRGSDRMHRRSRHVEQELERWVRGASS
ncbi:uncharacterized protein UTRI_05858_B [Ustilago trichophora]|uniref:Uncharacterized protein n=1 Tax=Ustilago trichophora TaxID=86804 RepID=A0A5C3ENM4_9BASI|nr:uncharacterized protein UTRI_05858_B [Ustilago trichophora]